MRDYVTIGLGADAKLDGQTSVSLDYQTSFDFDGSACSHTFAIRSTGEF